MGAEPWTCYAPYQSDIEATLRDVQDREFQAGRYDPYGVLAEEGLQPESIDDVRELMEDSGTGTVLDVLRISDSPDWFAACPLSPERLVALYGTDQPTRAMVETNLSVLDHIDRGQAVYVIAYENGQPDGILFAGYSFD